MNNARYLVFLFLLVAAMACKKEDAVKSYPDLIAGNWTLTKEIIKSTSPPMDTVITNLEYKSYVYGADGILIRTYERGEQSKTSYYVKGDTLVHVLYAGYATGYHSGTKFLEYMKITRLDARNMVVVYPYGGIPQNAQYYYYSERTFTR